MLPFGSELRSLISFRQVDDYPLYVMHVYGDYGLDGLLRTGSAKAAASPAAGQPADPWACTCFAAQDPAGHHLFGRNFDWDAHPALLLFTHPRHGYASVSMVDASYLGIGPTVSSWSDRRRLLGAPLLPFDGMNDRGLAVGMMAVPSGEPGRDPAKVTLDSVAVIRLMLDRAATVDEAVALLGSVNVDWGSGPPLHYLVADASGRSAVVEFANGQMIVLPRQAPWQAATNFTLAGRDAAESRSLCYRYAAVSNALGPRQGILSAGEAMQLLSAVSQPSTRWSVVYNQDTGDISVVAGRRYDRVHDLALRRRLGP
jgi:hypothetical protein